VRRAIVRSNPTLDGLALVAAAGFGVFGNDWLFVAAIAVLWAIWRMLPDDNGPPILALALTYQWVQVTAGMFYSLVTGRSLLPMLSIDYRPIVTISLVSVLALALGLYLGRKMSIGGSSADSASRPDLALTWGILVIAYATAIVAEASARKFAFQYPSLTQPILALMSIRLITLYILLRRLARPKFRIIAIACLTAFEAVLNATGYFANFREPLILAIVAVLEVFDRRRRGQVVAVAVFVVALAACSLVWINIRSAFRAEIDSRESFNTSARLDRIGSLASDWWRRGDSNHFDDVDFLVERVWAIYYPGLALMRVPSVIPHTDGSLLGAALSHVLQPRIFFPEKPELPSDSDLVRKYSGVFVAGRESNTSIAFGYVAESYVDFGVPLMFLPIVTFGVISGLIYGAFQRLIRHAEIRVPVVVVAFWLGLFLFERSWANFIGFSLTIYVYVGAAAWLLDRFLLIRFEAAEPPMHVDPHPFPSAAP
jgi:hypothetical protein